MSLRGNIRKTIFAAAALIALLPSVVSCGGGESKSAYTPTPVLSVKTNPVSHEAGSQYVEVSSSGDWSLTSSASWLTASPSSGTGSKNNVVLSYSSNQEETARTATLTLTNAGGTATVQFVQNPKGSSGGGGTPGNPDGRGWGAASADASWLELPQTMAGDGFEFFWHDMTIGAAKTRNYSFYWDYDNLVAKWVAYPLCTWNIGSSVGRTDAWGLDKLLPASCQPDVSGGFLDGNDGWYSRGHQIPSADRLTSYSANAATFYGTNMTPQDNTFNGGIWATLEGYVRNWAKGSDTLYVVTGCVTEGAKYYSLDRSGKKITVPTAYFKAVLRYKKSSTIGYSDFMSAGFYFDHVKDRSAAFSKSYSMSVSALEKKLGYKLFVNLDKKVGDETAKKIKDQDPTTVTWWWQ